MSVVICTYNRAESLARTLASLEYLTHPEFEVIVVRGPCTDDTSEVLEAFRGRVKVVDTDEANVSVARNLGVACAACDLVAFIDDDALADGAWLEELAAGFDDEEVAATFGPAFNPEGFSLQTRYCIADRWGDARLETERRRVDHFQHPDTWQFLYAIGANAMFSRERFLEVGGFDENFAFYLEEPDICIRLIERGFLVRPRDGALVHHKFLPSGIRNDLRITVDRYNLLFSRVYFAVRHGRPHSTEAALNESLDKFVAAHRADLRGHADSGRIPTEAPDRFDDDVDLAIPLARGRASESARLRDRAWFEQRITAFVPFPTLRPPGLRQRVCVVCAEDRPTGPPLRSVISQLIDHGDIVHVISPASQLTAEVTFEEGWWSHLVSWPNSPLSMTETAPITAARPGQWIESAATEVDRIRSLMGPVTVLYLGVEDSGTDQVQVRRLGWLSI